MNVQLWPTRSAVPPFGRIKSKTAREHQLSSPACANPLSSPLMGEKLEATALWAEVDL